MYTDLKRIFYCWACVLTGGGVAAGRSTGGAAFGAAGWVNSFATTIIPTTTVATTTAVRTLASTDPLGVVFYRDP